MSLTDSNRDLVGCYRMVRDDPSGVVEALERLAVGHAAGGERHYYAVRDGFNALRDAMPSRALAYTPALAAMLIYLNRTGFNGLFRLNGDGRFNVPAGRYARPRIFDPEHVFAISRVLARRGVSIGVAAFDRVVKKAQPGDFLYFDPPYAPLSPTARFTAYTAEPFTLDDHRRLRDVAATLAARGCHVMVSNSSAPAIATLYEETRRWPHRGFASIGCPPGARSTRAATARGEITELLLTNLESTSLTAARRFCGFPGLAAPRNLPKNVDPLTPEPLLIKFLTAAEHGSLAELHTPRTPCTRCATSHTSCTHELPMTSPSLGVLIVSGDSLVTGSLEHLLSQSRGCARAARGDDRDTPVRRSRAVDRRRRRGPGDDRRNGAHRTDSRRAARAADGVWSSSTGLCAPHDARRFRPAHRSASSSPDLTTDRLMRSLRQGIERQRVHQRLADLALRDELTGLYNRRGFFAIGEHLRRECLRHGRSLSVVQVDVDGLKSINDSFGHAAGDQAIAATASILRCTFRESDLVARLGGDEFVAIALDADRASTLRVPRAWTRRSRNTTCDRRRHTHCHSAAVLRAGTAGSPNAERPPRQRRPRALCEQAPSSRWRRHGPGRLAAAVLRRTVAA